LPIFLYTTVSLIAGVLVILGNLFCAIVSPSGSNFCKFFLENNFQAILFKKLYCLTVNDDMRSMTHPFLKLVYSKHFIFLN